MVSVAKLEQLLETSLTRAHGRAFFRGLAIAPPYLPSARPGAPTQTCLPISTCSHPPREPEGSPEQIFTMPDQA